VSIADVNRDGKPDLVIIPYDRDAKQRGGAENVAVLIGEPADLSRSRVHRFHSARTHSPPRW
jgi:hypothetical protein